MKIEIDPEEVRIAIITIRNKYPELVKYISKVTDELNLDTPQKIAMTLGIIIGITRTAKEFGEEIDIGIKNE